MDKLDKGFRVNKKGILLISTLFFVLVLIMMSVALFALTRANYADMKSFYSENEAINNAESAINIASFIIASQPNLLTVTVNSNNVNSPNLFDLNNSILARNEMNSSRIGYNIVAVELDSSPRILANNRNIRLLNFAVNGAGSGSMVALVVSPNNKNLVDSGAILFFGNSFDSNNTYKKDFANAVAINFNNNKINFYFSNDRDGNYPSIAGISYPLYTSVNNATNNADISNINGYRNANKYTVLLMAMGYSKVPNTNRYVVRYVDQKLANGGLLAAALFTGGNANFTTSGKLYITADQIKTNKLIANNFNVELVTNNSSDPAKTIFSLLSGSEDSGVVGKLIATTTDKRTGRYNVNGQNYTLEQILNNENSILDTVKNTTNGTVEGKQVSFNFDNTYSNFKNAVNSSLSSSNTYTLPAGWYIFKDAETIYYYPPDKTISDIINNDGSVERSRRIYNRILRAWRLKGSNGNVIATISDYSINFNENINVKFVGTSNKPNFVFITAFKSRESITNMEKFGAYDIKINLNNNIVQAQDLGVVIDGVIKGEGTFSVTGDGSNIGTTPLGFKYYDNGFFQPYNPGELTSSTNSLNKGTLVTKFDYLKSSSNKVAILVDNDMYINPTFQAVSTSFMDYLLMQSLKNWVSDYVNGPSKEDVFQVMAGFADQKFKIDGNIERNNLFEALFYNGLWQRQQNYTLQLKDGDFKDYKLSIDKSYWNYITQEQGGISNLTGTYTGTSTTTGNLTVSYGGYSVNISVDITNITSGSNGGFITRGTTDDYSGTTTTNIYTFRYGDRVVQIPGNLVPDSIKSVIANSSTNVNFNDFANLWYAILNQNPFAYLNLHNNIKNNLEGLYNEYKTFLANKGLKNNPGKNAFTNNGIDQKQIDKNYFAWIDFKEKGLIIGENAARKLGMSGDDVSYFDKVSRAIDSPSETNSKIEGMLMVKGNLKANTAAGNLTFRGLSLVKKNMDIKSKDLTFSFDLDSIDVNLLAGSVINLVPVLYRQESVISK